MGARSQGQYALAIDLGTSRVRCLLVDQRGRVRGSASADWAPRAPKELAPLGREIAPGRAWALVCRLVRQALHEGDVRPMEVAAVSATSQRQAVVFLDRSGSEIYAGPNTDLRAFLEGQGVDESHRDLVYRTTGHLPSFLFAPAKALWLKAHQPLLFERVACALSLDAWVAWKLSGEAAMERCSAAEAGLLDLATGEGATGLLSVLGLPSGLVPRLVDSGTPVGQVSRSAAAGAGLAAGTTVVAAGPDTQCGLLGMGVTGRGQVGILAGWSAPVQMALDRLCLDSARRTWSGMHLLQGNWVLESNAGDAGGAYRWLVSTLAMGRGLELDARVVREAARAPIGANGSLAFLGPQTASMGEVGPRMGGLLFPLLSGALPVERSGLLRAFLESVACAVRGNVEQLEEISGQQARSIGFAGGMAGNALLSRILAGVLGRPVERFGNAEVTGLGAAMCSATGLGWHGGLQEASRAMGRRGRLLAPDPAAAIEYEEHYRRWQEAAKRLESLAELL